MSRPEAFPVESKRRLLHLVIEALEEELPRREDALLAVVTAPEPAARPPRFDDWEPRLRMALSELRENLKTLRDVGEALPEVTRREVEVFSVVRVESDGKTAHYFITPCAHRFEQVLALEDTRVRAVHRTHELVGLRRGGSYVTGASIEPHTLKVHGTPHLHRVVDVF